SSAELSPRSMIERRMRAWRSLILAGTAPAAKTRNLSSSDRVDERPPASGQIIAPTNDCIVLASITGRRQRRVPRQAEMRTTLHGGPVLATGCGLPSPDLPLHLAAVVLAHDSDRLFILLSGSATLYPGGYSGYY